jgi:hypothetical protein
MSENNDNNIDINEKKKKGGSQKRSWVWQWFEACETGAICQVEVAIGQICNIHYKNGCSTGNLINHLANKHQITEETKKEDLVVRKEVIFYIFYLFNSSLFATYLF